MNQFVSIVFLLASLGVVNGFLLTFFLVSRKERTVADLYFSGLLFAMCTRIGKSVFLRFYDDVDLLILQIGLSACVFIGPFFYLYVKSEMKKLNQVSRQDIWMLVSLLFGIIIVGILYPYRSFPDYWNAYIVGSIYLVWLFFVGMGIWEARTLILKVFQTPRKLTSNETFLLGLITGVIFITFSYQFALFVNGVTYLWGAIGFTFFFYLLFFQKNKNKFWKQKTNSPEIPVKEGQQILRKVDALMEEQQLYKNPKLKLESLASEVEISKHQLSRLLNEIYPNGFSHYVNEWRIKEAKRLIKVKQELSLEGIGYDSGFNSKSSFFSTFKKMTNTTPSQFKKSLEEE